MLEQSGGLLIRVRLRRASLAIAMRNLNIATTAGDKPGRLRTFSVVFVMSRLYVIVDSPGANTFTVEACILSIKPLSDSLIRSIPFTNPV
jgi:hypothetical protein